MSLVVIFDCLVINRPQPVSLYHKDDKHISNTWNVVSITPCTPENVLSVITYAAFLCLVVFIAAIALFWKFSRALSMCVCFVVFSNLAENRLLCHTWAAGYFITTFAVMWHSPSPHHDGNCQHTLIQRATITHESDDVGGRPINVEQCESKDITEEQKGSRKKISQT